MSIRTTNFDALAASAPLDRQASVIRDGSGDLWDAKISEGAQAHLDAPPAPLSPRPAGQPDLTGHRFGRFKVMWFHGATSTKNPEPVWLARCSCGDYEFRRTKTILKAANPDDCCLKCSALKTLQARASKPNTRKARKLSALMLDQMAEGSR